ncbi:Serine/threonine-protein phosphatase PP1 isozyme 1 [Tritrichomonas foetus]|uniref:Serine/threonine-protein phosphatase n=1 Tax=Tritrichomonas foetus TaxID=1144522 RepID=A0A1J4JU54_9EUKA|nr:Serine/threonine-protein phosphatase PP1 isozyme 1 [Tritrichomonas foetus]|eukprot:OHT02665.1 Serine/threonine-protein phosphatase PP1 isozyme 1 [Tritrichomonas foetus]
MAQAEENIDIYKDVVREYQKFYLSDHISPQEVGFEYPIPKLTTNQLLNLLKRANEIIKDMPPILSLERNIYIVGDLHGNLNDLIRIFKECVKPEENKILFLGDYVDRGTFSIEVITLLFALLIEYPQNIFLIRGNHEFSSINESYGFRDQIVGYYRNEEIWNRFNDVFNWLPLGAIIGGDTFCVHGGISDRFKFISKLESIQRPIVDFSDNIICDSMWSDPTPRNVLYIPSSRGKGKVFGFMALKDFLERNKMKRLIRAHQCVSDGVEMFSKENGYTVFSCSNYGIGSRNKCGVLKIESDDNLTIFCLDALDIDESKSISYKLIGIKQQFCQMPVRTLSMSLKMPFLQKGNVPIQGRNQGTSRALHGSYIAATVKKRKHPITKPIGIAPVMKMLDSIIPNG